MDNRAEVREFLVSRRAKITPPERRACRPEPAAECPACAAPEVAALAGVSIEYYSKLERGALAGVSAGVLDAIARALQLDDAERGHLFHLAHAADGTAAGMRPRRWTSRTWTPPPTLQWVLDRFLAPALVRNGRTTLVFNRLGWFTRRALDSQQPTQQGHQARKAPAGQRCE